MSFISKSKDVIGLDYVFTFGKHNDELLEEVLKTDPEYIIWCSDEIEWFDLDTDVYDMAVDRDATINHYPFDEFSSYDWYDKDD